MKKSIYATFVDKGIENKIMHLHRKIVRIYYNVLISSDVDEHLSCLQFGTIVNKVSMNILLHIFVLLICTFQGWTI